jgi:hypothetical protein
MAGYDMTFQFFTGAASTSQWVCADLQCDIVSLLAGTADTCQAALWMARWN